MNFAGPAERVRAGAAASTAFLQELLRAAAQEGQPLEAVPKSSDPCGRGKFL